MAIQNDRKFRRLLRKTFFPRCFSGSTVDVDIK